MGSTDLARSPGRKFEAVIARPVNGSWRVRLSPTSPGEQFGRIEFRPIPGSGGATVEFVTSSLTGHAPVAVHIPVTIAKDAAAAVGWVRRHQAHIELFARSEVDHAASSRAPIFKSLTPTSERAQLEHDLEIERRERDRCSRESAGGGSSVADPDSPPSACPAPAGWRSQTMRLNGCPICGDRGARRTIDSSLSEIARSGRRPPMARPRCASLETLSSRYPSYGVEDIVRHARMCLRIDRDDLDRGRVRMGETAVTP